jgi:poly(3-hydroxybutyrate) depolymerase
MRFNITLFFLLLSQFLFSQKLRYLDPIFTQVSKTANVTYGNAPSITSIYISESWTTNIDLKMDIFQPVGDTVSKRPLIIFIHSGGFINGSKDHQDMQYLCDSFARRGYVTCSINYRLNFNLLSSTSAERAVYRGLQDAAAAIRYMKAFRNTYKIDTNYIFPWGSSAGGFTALNLAYLDDAERPASTFASGSRPDLKCINCVGNSYQHQHKVKAIVNCWGAIGNTNWISAANNIPALLFHGTADNTVPYNQGNPFGLSTLPSTFGSLPIAQKLTSENILNELNTGQGKGHEYWGTSNGTFSTVPTADYQDIINKAALFLYKQLPIAPILRAKVLLANTDSATGTMDNYVASLSNFPLSDPYRSQPLNTRFLHINNNKVDGIVPNLLANATDPIIDWMFVELRQGNPLSTTVVATKAALMRKDGTLFSTDGITAVQFPNVSSGNYYIALKHRNHLGFRTLHPVLLNNLTPLQNFSNNSISLNGTYALTNNGTYPVLIGGDANSDGSIDAFDTIIWENHNGLFDDYQLNSDYNLDASIDALDAIIWEMNNGKFEQLD